MDNTNDIFPSADGSAAPNGASSASSTPTLPTNATAQAAPAGTATSSTSTQSGPTTSAMSNAPATEAPKLEKVEQKPKKKKHRFLKFLLVLVLIIGGIGLVSFLKKKHDEKEFEEYLGRVLREDKWEVGPVSEELLNAPSDIDGMSIIEKAGTGLSIARDDSDGDGLSDNDEINTYNTNPALYSTVGDIYGDGYKVANNLDLTKDYGSSETISVADGKVVLVADEARDLEAVYMDYYGSVPGNYVFASQPFRVFSFTGRVLVKIESPDNYDVISYDNYRS